LLLVVTPLSLLPLHHLVPLSSITTTASTATSTSTTLLAHTPSALLLLPSKPVVASTHITCTGRSHAGLLTHTS
jgi:hypothetical protein